MTADILRAETRGKAMESSAIKTAVGVENTATEETIAERRLWTAVLVHAVEDWRRGTLRARRQAQQFLFEDDQDFSAVCASAGLDPGNLRARLIRTGTRLEPHVRFVHPLVA
jgi:hypothetical protein